MEKVLESTVTIPEPYKSAHAESSLHKETILQSHWVGCFYCQRIYPPKQIVEWTDNDKTAICPLCGIDSVIPMTLERFDSDFLEKMDEIYFS